MKNIFWFILFSFFILSEVEGFAQKADSISFRKNVISGELLGNGFPGSINYERMIINNKNSFVTVKIGGNGILFPLLINQVFDKNTNNHLEFGGGISLEVGKNRFTQKINYVFAGTVNLMYRYQKSRGRFIFRAGWTPLFWFDKAQLGDPREIILFLLIPGVSIGFAF